MSYIRTYCVLLVVFASLFVFPEGGLAERSVDLPPGLKGMPRFKTIIGVKRVKGRLIVNWNGKEAEMSGRYSLNYCGSELASSIENLRSLIGKPCSVILEETREGPKVKRVECSCPE